MQAQQHRLLLSALQARAFETLQNIRPHSTKKWAKLAIEQQHLSTKKQDGNVQNDRIEQKTQRGPFGIDDEHDQRDRATTASTIRHERRFKFPVTFNSTGMKSPAFLRWIQVGR